MNLKTFIPKIEFIIYIKIVVISLLLFSCNSMKGISKNSDTVNYVDPQIGGDCTFFTTDKNTHTFAKFNGANVSRKKRL